jgi:putative peptidoglycan lipid II flippase
MLLIRVYYAIHDVRTPLITGLISIGVNIIFSFILIGFMDHGGLSLANTIAAAVNALLLFYFLNKRLNLLAGDYLKSGLVQTIFATSAMCVPVYLGKVFWPHMSSKSGLALEILALICAAVAVYFLVLKLMHSETLKDINKGLAKKNRHDNI